MLAHSKADLLAYLRNFWNSLFPSPEPSAMLLEILIPAPRNWSADRNNFWLSKKSAIKNNSPVISIAIFHISKFSNQNTRLILVCFKFKK